MPKPEKRPVTSGSPAPWDEWQLDKKFFERLSRYDKDHPETNIGRIMDSVREGLQKHKPLLDLVPDNPFPARGLVTALAHLLQLGIAVTRAQDCVNEFAQGIATWVEEVKHTFQSVDGGRFTWATWKQLGKMRDLIDEICVWAAARLKDKRWARVFHGLSVESEIKDFNARLTEARELFRDLSMINLSGGIDAILTAIRLLMRRQDTITREIMKIRQRQSEQLDQIIDELAAQKRREERRRFLAQNLLPSTVANPTYTEQGKHPCDKETRIQVLAEIMEWINDVSRTSRNFLWLSGDPGCGKSAITASIARACKDNKTLWAQFFINRNNEQTTNPNSYFPTIARQLTELSNEVENAVYDALKAQPSLMDNISAEQAAKLFVEAIEVACKIDPKAPVVIVIDGLDETDRSRLQDTAIIFSHLFEGLAKYPNAKIFISSRTEHEIRNPFAKNMKSKHVKHIHLDTSVQSSINDVAGFLERQLRFIVDENDLGWNIWPGQQRLDMLSKRAAGLFIWAVTVTKYLREEIDFRGTECLDDILHLLTGDALGDINTLYRIILKLSYESRANAWDFEKFRKIVGAIVVMREPLCLEDIGRLLDLRQRPDSAPVDIVRFVQRLRTVLVAGTDAVTGKTVPRLHKSFFEFITSVDDVNFHVEPAITEGELALCCLKQLGKTEEAFGSYHLPGSFRYASRYGSSHISQANFKDTTRPVKSTVNREDFLGHIQMVTRINDEFPSSIAISPDHSQISRILHNHRYKWNMQEGRHISTVLEGYETALTSVAITHDGLMLLSASEHDPDLRVWHLSPNGCKSTKLATSHEGGITCLALSNNGTRLATGSDDCSVCLWDLPSQSLITSFTLANARITYLVFSPGDDALLYGCEDGVIHLWDTENLVQISPSFTHHSGPVLSIAFFTDGRQVISASTKGDIFLWSPFSRREDEQPNRLRTVTTGISAIAFSANRSRLAVVDVDGQCCFYEDLHEAKLDKFRTIRQSGIDRDCISAVSFSPSGNEILAGFRSGNIQIIDIKDFSTKHSLSGHSDAINTLAFAKDGLSVVSGGEDKTVRIWSLSERKGESKLPSQPTSNSQVPIQQRIKWMSFSECGELILYALGDGTTYLFDNRSNPPTCKPLTTPAIQLRRVAFSPDNAYIAGSSMDGRICLWAVNSCDLVASSRADFISEVKHIAFEAKEDGLTLNITYSDSSVHCWMKEGSRLVGAKSNGHAQSGSQAESEHSSFDNLLVNSTGKPKIFEVIDHRNAENSSLLWADCSDHFVCFHTNGIITTAARVVSISRSSSNRSETE